MYYKLIVINNFQNPKILRKRKLFIDRIWKIRENFSILFESLTAFNAKLVSSKALAYVFMHKTKMQREHADFPPSIYLFTNPRYAFIPTHENIPPRNIFAVFIDTQMIKKKLACIDFVYVRINREFSIREERLLEEKSQGLTLDNKIVERHASKQL